MLINKGNNKNNNSDPSKNIKPVSVFIKNLKHDFSLKKINKLKNYPGKCIKAGSLKYSVGHGSDLLGFITEMNEASLGPVQQVAGMKETLGHCIHASLAAGTWQKYNTGWRAYNAFEAHTRTRFDWPLCKEAIRGFVVFCLQERKLKPSSVKTYLSSLVCLHKLKGFTDFEIKDSLVDSILRGAGNILLTSANPPSNRRRVATLPTVRHLGHQLSKSGWSESSKQSIWSAALTAFFVSARMGELLSPSESSIDPTSTLTWACVKYIEKENRFILHVRLPKTGSKEGEFLDILPFPDKRICPVSALKRQHRIQCSIGLGRPQDPVFAFSTGRLLTPAGFNSALKVLLADICDYRRDSITGHSFRAGIPSAVARCPDLMSSDDVKNWGRWSSNTYERYQRLKSDEKMAIFAKIIAALYKF
jgi:hypothetical protein